MAPRSTAWLAACALLTACTPSGSTEAPDDAPGAQETAVAAEDTGTPRAFVPFEGDATAPDVRTDRLCAGWDTPDALADTTYIDCRVEGAAFAPRPPTTGRGPLRVMVWNMERGQRIDAQLAAWRSGALPVPDILLASEVDRGCTRSGGRNVPRDIAEALGLDYVFGVEFVELPRGSGSGGRIEETCEHGNALFSRFPLGNVQWTIHRDNLSWYLPPERRAQGGEPRLGGRSFLAADTRIDGQLVHLVTLHFESRVIPPEVQRGQGAEVAEHVAAIPGPALVGGDTNAASYFLDVADGRTTADTVQDPTIAPLLKAGLVDAHAPLPPEGRNTSRVIVIDLLLGKGGTFSAPEVCAAELCDDLSDHRAIWATFTVD